MLDCCMPPSTESCVYVKVCGSAFGMRPLENICSETPTNMSCQSATTEVFLLLEDVLNLRGTLKDIDRQRQQQQQNGASGLGLGLLGHGHCGFN